MGRCGESRDAFQGVRLQNWLNGLAISQGGETAGGTGLEVEIKYVSSTSGLTCQWVSKWTCRVCIHSSGERLMVATPIWEPLAWGGT